MGTDARRYRLGVVIIPATTLLEADDLRDRLVRGRVKVVVTDATLAERFKGLTGASLRICVGDARSLGSLRADAWTCGFVPGAAPTRADDLLFLYFTSGTTAKPKLVAHTPRAIQSGHLSTMYWLGLQRVMSI